jgi:hypothetical protein
MSRLLILHTYEESNRKGDGKCIRYQFYALTEQQIVRYTNGCIATIPKARKIRNLNLKSKSVSI